MDQGVIRRKLAAAQGPSSLRGEGGAEKAWPVALARAARELCGLALDCGQVRARRYSLAELMELVPDLSLIAVLEGPRGANGVMFISPALLSGLIEAQTLGRVMPQPPAPRKPTRTDAAMVADWVDSALTGLEDALLLEEDLVWTDGFRFASYLDEPRPLPLMLEDADYKVLLADCDMQNIRQGQLVLALPADGHGRRPQRNLRAEEEAAGRDFNRALRGQLAEAEAVMQGVLSRITLPLAGMLGLQPGDVLQLPRAALDRIEMTGIDGEVHGVARLGQSRGMRAVRILAADEAPEALIPAASAGGGNTGPQALPAVSPPPLAATG